LTGKEGLMRRGWLRSQIAIGIRLSEKAKSGDGTGYFIAAWLSF